jgi:cellulose synthase/poly-beta-1,6-N-acetylglucosamine synthase-like glycosyltransferase
MEQRPLVSVVVPTYQRVAVLEEALRSALAQTYDRLELLVEDDGSTDGTEAMVAALGDSRVRYAWAPNVGYPAPVRNRAIRKATGTLVAFLDSDDLWEPRKLERQVAALARDPALLGVSCRADTIPPSRRRVTLVPDTRPSFEEVLRKGGGILNSGTVVRREALDAVGLLDEDRTLRAVEDLDLWLRILRHRDRSILVLAERLFRYRVSGDAISTVGGDELAKLARILEKHAAFRPEAVREALTERERALRRNELVDGLRRGTLPLSRWLSAPEVPLRRRLRIAARAVLLGRGRV